MILNFLTSQMPDCKDCQAMQLDSEGCSDILCRDCNKHHKLILQEINEKT